MNTSTEEGAFLHLKMFGSHAPAEILTQYAHYIDARQKDTPCESLHTCQKNNINVVAVEYALRLCRRKNTLTQRMEALSLICEVHPEHYKHYYSDQSGLCRAYLSLGFHGVKAALLLVRGKYLIWRHSLE